MAHDRLRGERVTQYDAIIIGAGAGGGVAAGVLAEAGKRVLLLERGRDLSCADVGRDHLRNQRRSQYGNNVGPDDEGNPRVFVDDSGEHILPPSHGQYQNNAACVGSGTRVYGAQAWRFLPQDFRMATIYGVPAGSSLADWPIDYPDLAPYYEQAEWEIGVAGDSAASATLWPRAKAFPMPPLDVTRPGAALRAGAARLGWSTFAPPVLINTVPYGGRPACIKCQHCVGFACPSDGKNGTHNTLIPRALASGRCDLVDGATVERIDTGATGQIVGVAYFGRDGQRVQARAAAVVVSAGAIETARLLLNSTSSMHPRGLGNQYDQVGRHLQGHYYPGSFGLMPEPIYDGQGPGISTATCDFNHGNDGVIGGAMLCDEFIVLPIIFWKHHLPPDLPRWGSANKAFMRQNYRRVM